MIAPLMLEHYQDLVKRALDEDIRGEDVTTTSTVDPTLHARGVFLAKSPCVVAGLDVAFEAFRQLDPDVVATIHIGDGSTCQPGDEIAVISGLAGPMLTAERVALNFLQRLCGIATRTRLFVDAAAGRIIVLDTRKTTPLFRALEKYAVRAGGGTNHRSSLSEAILIKDNHIRLAGGVREAVKRVRKRLPGMALEIEAQSLEQVDEALAAGAERILLDNLSIDENRSAVARIGGRARTEISGGVTLERMAEIASTGADFVSVGSLTHSSAQRTSALRSSPPDAFVDEPAPLPDDFADAIASLGDTIYPIASTLQYFAIAGSTNDIALRLAARAGHEGHEGAVVLAGEQHAGRGRRGRTWFSPCGSGLYVSVILTPGRTRGDAARATRLLTLTVGVALVEAIEMSTGLSTHLKWPNDVYVSTRKLAGILAEASNATELPPPVVVGYGINVATSASPPELRTRMTSLESELGRTADGARVFASSLSCLARRYEDLLAGRFDAILDAWRAHSPSSRGTSIAWMVGDRRQTGVTAGIDVDGALLANTGDSINRIVAGEIEWFW